MKQLYKPSELDIEEWNKKECKPLMINFLSTFSKIPQKEIEKVINLEWSQLPERFQQAWILSHKQAFEEDFPLTNDQIKRGLFKI